MDFSGSDIRKLKKIGERYNDKIQEMEIKPIDEWDFIDEKVAKFRQTEVGTLNELYKKENEVRELAKKEFKESIKDRKLRIDTLKKEKKEELFKNSYWVDKKNGEKVFLWLWDKAEVEAETSFETCDYPTDEYSFFEDLEEDFLNGLSLYLEGK